MSFNHKFFKCSNPFISATQWCKPLIFQTTTIWYNRIHSLKYIRSTTSGRKDFGVIKSEFAAKTQFLFSAYLEGSRFSHYILFLAKAKIWRGLNLLDKEKISVQKLYNTIRTKIIVFLNSYFKHSLVLIVKTPWYSYI